MTPEEILAWTEDPTPAAAFEVLHSLATPVSSVSDNGSARHVRDLVIRLHEHRRSLGDGAVILDGLVRELGLFPYLDPEALDSADLIAFEAHRPLEMPDPDVVFHEAQG